MTWNFACSSFPHAFSGNPGYPNIPDERVRANAGSDQPVHALPSTNFGDNKIPSICDIPPLKTVIQEFPVGNGPYGGMSIGEPPVIPTAPAIANAVQDAVGVRIYDLPITAEKVLRALQKRT